MRVFPKVVLYLGVLAFGGFGLWLFADPAGIASMGLPIDPGSLWRVEVRAFFGGLEVGLAAFLFMCARRPAWAPAGLAALALLLGGTGVGRAMGLLLDHRADTGMLINAVSEIIGAAIAVAAFRAHARSLSSPDA